MVELTHAGTADVATAKGRLSRRLAKRAVLALALLAGTAAAGDYGYHYWTTGRFMVSTDDAYAQADYTTIAPKISGYTVTNSVTVHVRELGILGDMLDKEVSVGANTINGISFAVEDPSKLYDEARKAAFADAKGKADLYADAAGVSLGSIQTI